MEIVYVQGSDSKGIVKSLGEPKIRELVLDVLKPHTPPLPDFASFLAEFSGIEEVEVSLVEMDERTESLGVILRGQHIDYARLKEHMGKQGAVIHSVDKVTVEIE
jgi:hypothetical protein